MCVYIYIYIYIHLHVKSAKGLETMECEFVVCGIEETRKKKKGLATIVSLGQIPGWMVHVCG